jgi:NADH dehydrogenase
VVIVGGGFGGLFTALALQRRQPSCPIVLIEPRDRFLFQPLLYELLSDELQGWEVAPRYDQLLNNSVCWIQDTVVGIDQTSQSIELASGDRLGWAQLVLATGSKANDFGIPGVKEHGSGFRDLSDVSRLKQWINNLD